MRGKAKITLAEAVSIGIGGMVGGGIFAVLGLAIAFAKGGTPVAFFLAGFITLLTSYSYSRLSLKYPSKGGTVKFINIAFGRNAFSGGTNNLLWVSYIIMLSLYSAAFGSYASTLIHIVSDVTLNKHILLSAIIVISALINYINVKVVAVTESYAVYIKLIILFLFIFIGAYGLTQSEFVFQLEVSNWSLPLRIISGGMVIFVAYEGFELIANATPEIKNPVRNIPRAYYISIGIVILLYIMIAIITVGSLDFDSIDKAEDYVLAVAARPVMKEVGFTIIAIAAMISTFSAINATLFGGSRVNYIIAEDEELPHEFTKHFWGEPIGLAVTTILTLVIANSLDLISISTSGSAGFLLIFALVNYANIRLYKETSSNRIISWAGFILCLVAVVVLLVNQWEENLKGTLITLGIIIGCYILETVYKSFDKQKSQQ